MAYTRAGRTPSGSHGGVGAGLAVFPRMNQSLKFYPVLNTARWIRPSCHKAQQVLLLRNRPDWADFWFGSARFAAQWWAAASLFPTPVARGLAAGFPQRRGRRSAHALRNDVAGAPPPPSPLCCNRDPSTSNQFFTKTKTSTKTSEFVALSHGTQPRSFFRTKLRSWKARESSPGRLALP